MKCLGAIQRYKGLEPVVLQDNAEVNREGEIEMKSQSHSEDNREEDKRKGNTERVHTERLVKLQVLDCKPSQA